MHKLFSIFFFLVLYVGIAFSQATVDIPLSGTDGTITIPLAIGLDQTATSGIDPALGESDLPPFPPAGAFEIRFDLSPYTGQPLSSYKDYRYAASFPFTGQVEHTLWYQTSANNLPINITYNLPNGAQMTLRDQLGGVILNLGPFTGQGTATLPGSYTNIFVRCLVIMDYTTVPVELTSFTASIVGDGVQLNWNTATELNNQGFEIERKAAGDWVKIGYVPGHGTTTEPQSYSFSDKNVSKGTYTYRLKQLDFGGGYNYSPEVSVEVDFTPSEYALSQNYPNPFNPSTTIMYQVPKAGNVSIIIYDMLGQEVRILMNNEVAAGAYQVQWDGLNDSGVSMSSGTYIYRMTAGDFVESKEMILVK
jgi:hypothetical protein